MGTAYKAELAARRHAPLLGSRPDILQPLFATWTDANLDKAMKPGNYVKFGVDTSGDAPVTIIKFLDPDKFPQVINTNKAPGAVEGILGQPEKTLYKNAPVAQPSPPV